MRGLVFSIGFLILVVVAGCSRKVAPSSSTEVTSKKDSIVYKEVIKEVEVPVPGETVTLTKYIECDSVTNKPKPFHFAVKSGKAKADVVIDEKGEMNVVAGCDSTLAKVAVLEKQIERYQKESKSKSETIPEFKTRRVDIFCRWWTSATLFLLLAVFIYKLKFKNP
ncbi:MAG: hypothetical protein HOP30_21725 [Cyclobacteriaceae bacterium]|nr:hypothetical protein [Cyclobacteriaceae bacterium]